MSPVVIGMSASQLVEIELVYIAQYVPNRQGAHEWTIKSVQVRGMWNLARLIMGQPDQCVFNVETRLAAVLKIIAVRCGVALRLPCRPRNAKRRARDTLPATLSRPPCFAGRPAIIIRNVEYFDSLPTYTYLRAVLCRCGNHNGLGDVIFSSAIEHGACSQQIFPMQPVC